MKSKNKPKIGFTKRVMQLPINGEVVVIQSEEFDIGEPDFSVQESGVLVKSIKVIPS
jgi:hypothetical protein